MHLIFFFFLMLPRQPRSTLFPYTTLFRSYGARPTSTHKSSMLQDFERHRPPEIDGDRKSTRLNSSHSQISYAVFCLKKKKKKKKKIPINNIVHLSDMYQL